MNNSYVRILVSHSIRDHYGLAICLEVAEHLSCKTEAHLVHALTQSAPLVLFSAAVPALGGSHHISGPHTGVSSLLPTGLVSSIQFDP
jgi:hypothetical protein